MSKFRKSLSFTSGEVLKTRKNKVTKWTFISESHSNPSTGRRYVNARCQCGKEKVICINNVRCGNSMCCGAITCKPRIERTKDIQVGYRALLYVYRKHAKERNFAFTIDYDYFKKLLSGNCHYCGIKPIQVYQLKHRKTGKIRSGIPINYNGIDRVNPLLGYSYDNIVTCCKICNRAKSNLSLDEFKQWISNVYSKTIKIN